MIVKGQFKLIYQLQVLPTEFHFTFDIKAGVADRSAFKPAPSFTVRDMAVVS